MPVIPFIQINEFACFFQNFLLAGIQIVLKKILLEKNLLLDFTTFLLYPTGNCHLRTLDQVLQQELRRKIFYLNLNGRQSLVLFQDVYCDYQLVANHIYNFMKREYMERFYLAVSRKFEGYENLPSVLEQLEQ